MKAVVMWTFSAVIGLGLPLYGNAQTSRSDPVKGGGDEKKMAAADQKFMTKAASGGKAEVELGRLASERGTSDAVKQFAQRMGRRSRQGQRGIDATGSAEGDRPPGRHGCQTQAAHRPPFQAFGR
jgi:predicted outer membrane protein